MIKHRMMHDRLTRSTLRWPPFSSPAAKRGSRKNKNICFARLQPGDDYLQASGLRVKYIFFTSAGGRVIMVTRLEPSDCGKKMKIPSMREAERG